MNKPLAVVTLLIASIVGWARPASAADFTVSSAGQGAYVISGLNGPDGQNNPTLTLTRGRTYTFDVKGSFHPMWIKTAPTLGSDDDVYGNGVTNNGAGPGIVSFTVPLNAPSPLYYQCQFHEPMNGELRLVAAATPAPALPPSGFVLLGSCLSLLGALALFSRWRRRVA